MSAPDINTQLCDLLGVQWRGQHITGLTLRLRARRLPTLTVHHEVIEDGQLQPQRIGRYRLEPVEDSPPAPAPQPAGFHLDAACAAARERVQEHIQQAASEALAVVALRVRDEQRHMAHAIGELRYANRQRRASNISRLSVLEHLPAALQQLRTRPRSAPLVHLPVRRAFAGRALVETAGAVAFFALALGWLGPALDADTYASHGYAPARLEAGELERLEAEARAHCARSGNVNGGYIRLDDGVIQCTDKRGRRLALQQEQRP